MSSSMKVVASIWNSKSFSRNVSFNMVVAYVMLAALPTLWVGGVGY